MRQFQMVALLKHTMYCPWHRRLRHSVQVLLIQTFSNVFKSFESPYWSSKYPAYSVCHDVFVQMSVPDTGNSDQLLCLLYAMQPEIEACSYILFSEPLSKGTVCHLLSNREKTWACWDIHYQNWFIYVPRGILWPALLHIDLIWGT